jgi:hypothetical protein
MSSFNLPSEYMNLSNDFGFTAVDDDDPTPVPVVQAPPIDTAEISGPILEKIEEIYAVAKAGLNKLEQLDQVLNASVKDLDDDEYHAAMKAEYQERLTKLEQMIVPLLVNLMKNPEKDYIKWPNRKPIIEAQIEKILQLTRT